MGGYIEPGLPRGDPPRTPPYVCGGGTFWLHTDSLSSFLTYFYNFCIHIHIHEGRPNLSGFTWDLQSPCVVRVWSVLTRALLPRSCVPLAALPGATRTALLRKDSDRPF